jgi:hypothetical protein
LLNEVHGILDAQRLDGHNELPVAHTIHPFYEVGVDDPVNQERAWALAAAAGIIIGQTLTLLPYNPNLAKMSL